MKKYTLHAMAKNDKIQITKGKGINMKKLTAGIFSVIVGLVSANAADAAVASKGYVDAKVGVNTASIETLSGTVAANATTAAAATKTVADDLSAYKTTNDAAVAAKVAQSDYDAKVADLQTQINGKQVALKVAADSALKLDDQGNLSLEGIATSEGLANLTTTVGEHTTALNTLNADASNVNSVAGKIAAAVNPVAERVATAEGEIDALQAADTTINNTIATLATKAELEANATADATLAGRVTTAEGEIDALQAADITINNKIGTVAEGTTVVQMIADAKTAATYDDTAVKADIAAIKTSAYATSGITSELVGKISANETAIGALDDTYATDTALTTAVDGLKANEIKAASDAAAAAQSTADGAVSVNTAQQTEIDALETGKIPVPGVECNNMSNYCVLTYGTDPVTQQPKYYWEVIERGADEVAPYTSNPA